jgi:hypothetical protein
VKKADIGKAEITSPADNGFKAISAKKGVVKGVVPESFQVGRSTLGSGALFPLWHFFGVSSVDFSAFHFKAIS